MFNGGSGYILKPEFMRNEALIYSPVSPCGLDPVMFPALKMDVKVISGQNLFLADGTDCDDPYVKIKIRGHPDDEDNDRYDLRPYKVKMCLITQEFYIINQKLIQR